MLCKKLLIGFMTLAFFFGSELIYAETADFYYNRGKVNAEAFNYHLAMDDYDRAIEIKPDYAEAYNSRGEIYLAVSEFTKAEAEFTMAITANPYYEPAYINRGKLYRIGGKFDLAIIDWTKAVELNPNLNELKSELGDLYLSQGVKKGTVMDIKGAINDLSIAAHHNPKNPEIWYRLGILLLYIGDIENAEECFGVIRLIMMGMQELNHLDLA